MSRGAVKKRKKLNTDNLAPGIAAGITIGASVEEAAREHPIKPIRPLHERLAHMHDQGTGRVPTPRFHAENKDTGFVRESLDRRFVDTEITFPPEVLRGIQAGAICLRCLEPQATPFGDDHIPGCEGVGLRGKNYMRDWQLIDLAHEMEGTKHLGPSKPMREYLDEQEERVEKARFDQKIAQGASRMTGLR
jgi:hypothetical protein